MKKKYTIWKLSVTLTRRMLVQSSLSGTESAAYGVVILSSSRLSSMKGMCRSVIVSITAWDWRKLRWRRWWSLTKTITARTSRLTAKWRKGLDLATVPYQAEADGQLRFQPQVWISEHGYSHESVFPNPKAQLAQKVHKYIPKDIATATSLPRKSASWSNILLKTRNLTNLNGPTQVDALKVINRCCMYLQRLINNMISSHSQ